jgi:hypothetical protein
MIAAIPRRRGHVSPGPGAAVQSNKGRGYRHQFYATGLTGWQRAAPTVPDRSANDNPP